jgi:hypothetical protein
VGSKDKKTLSIRSNPFQNGEINTFFHYLYNTIKSRKFVIDGIQDSSKIMFDMVDEFFRNVFGEDNFEKLSLTTHLTKTVSNMVVDFVQITSCLGSSPSMEDPH